MSKMIPIPYWSKQRILAHIHTSPFWIPEAVDSESGPSLDRAIAACETSNWFCRPLLEMELEKSFTGVNPIKGDPEPILRELKRDAIKYNTRIVLIISRKKGIRLKNVFFAFIIGEPDHIQVEKSVVEQLRETARHMRKSLKKLGVQ